MAKKKAKKPKPPKFLLTIHPLAQADAKLMPPVLRPSFEKIIEHLRREGCRAADYALSGRPPWPNLCSIHFDGWRVIVTFPSANEVVIVKVAPHDQRNDPYREIADLLDVPISTDERTKPPCCEADGEPPVDPAAAMDVDAAFRRLSVRQRRELSRRR